MRSIEVLTFAQETRKLKGQSRQRPLKRNVERIPKKFPERKKVQFSKDLQQKKVNFGKGNRRSVSQTWNAHDRSPCALTLEDSLLQNVEPHMEEHMQTSSVAAPCKDLYSMEGHCRDACETDFFRTCVPNSRDHQAASDHVQRQNVHRRQWRISSHDGCFFMAQMKRKHSNHRNESLRFTPPMGEL